MKFLLGFWQSKQGQTHVLWSGFPPVSSQAKKNKRTQENELIVWLLGTSSSLISVGEIAVKIRRSLQVKCWKANSRWMHWTRHRHYFVGNKGLCTMQDPINTLLCYCAAQRHYTIPDALSSALIKMFFRVKAASFMSAHSQSFIAIYWDCI